ncbi:60S ribosomal protein L30-2 [Galdieria sulphuraria]|nr:60S ribosomal protein L30-2 [Galdieria sulphuraria]
MKSGKTTLGLKSTLKSLRQGKTKLVVLANNCPPLVRSQIEYYCLLAKCNVHHFQGNNVELGTACGKYFRCACLGITDPGDSDILKDQFFSDAYASNSYQYRITSHVRQSPAFHDEFRISFISLSTSLKEVLLST